jgi:GAF domain-containing protein
MEEMMNIMEVNTEIAKKFSRIETELSTLFDARTLFETLVCRIEEEFGIPFVWLSIIEKPELSELIQSLCSSEIIEGRLNIIPEAVLLNITRNNTTAILANDTLHPFYELLPASKRFLIRSLAIAPITLDGKIIGSINHGDFSPERYRAGMDTRLLEQMALKVSLYLSSFGTFKS